MTFIKKNIDWIFAGFYALVTLLYPTIKFISGMLYNINNYGSDKKSILFLWRYMLLDSDAYPYLFRAVYFSLLLPIPIVILASYRFQKNVKDKDLIQEVFNKNRNNMIFKELLHAYKRALIYVGAVSILMLLVAFIIPSNGIYESGNSEIMEVLTMNIGLILFVLIVTNVSVISARFTKKYRYTIILGVMGFIVGTLMMGLIFESIKDALNIDLFYSEMVLYNLIWESKGYTYIVELVNGVVIFAITGYIIHLIYTGDKSIEE
jgi:hypothetical protein